MIGSITEQQAEMAALAARRQAIAQADAAKRRKDKPRERDLVDAATQATGEGYLAAQAAEAEQDQADDAEAVKGLDAGVAEGPGSHMQPGPVEPGQHDRGYIEAGHAAESPQAEAPRENPLPGMQHAVLPSEPMAARIPPHVIANFTMGSPSERAR